MTPRWLPVLLLAALAGCPAAEETRRSKIAFAVALEGTNRAIMVVDPAGGEPETIAPSESFDETPAWSPDGFTLLFASGRDNHFGIYSWEGKLGKVAMAQRICCGRPMKRA